MHCSTESPRLFIHDSTGTVTLTFLASIDRGIAPFFLDATEETGAAAPTGTVEAIDVVDSGTLLTKPALEAVHLQLQRVAVLLADSNLAFEFLE